MAGPVTTGAVGATRSFRWGEFVTGPSSSVIERRWLALRGDPAALAAVEQVAEVLQALRDLLGGPVHITSAYRGPTRTGSQHDTGHAADIQVRGMSPLALIGALHAWAPQSPHPLRQVLAETLSTDPATLGQPMAEHSGRWVHVAIRTGEWTRASSRPWATSAAPATGDRQYRTWRPT